MWSKDIEVALRTARGIRAGTVVVNGYSEGDIGTPFGGYKLSGFGGRDNGLGDTPLEFEIDSSAISSDNPKSARSQPTCRTRGCWRWRDSSQYDGDKLRHIAGIGPIR